MIKEYLAKSEAEFFINGLNLAADFIDGCPGAEPLPGGTWNNGASCFYQGKR